MDRSGSPVHLAQAVRAWREKHGLAADDPLVAAVELMQLHLLSLSPRIRGYWHLRRWVAVLSVLIGAAGGFVLGRALP